MMINIIKAAEIVRKYSPTTKLILTDGCDGLYRTESNEIVIGINWHLGGLLHELAHAMLYIYDNGRTGHDAVFADTLTRLIGEVFCNENNN